MAHVVTYPVGRYNRFPLLPTVDHSALVGSLCQFSPCLRLDFVAPGVAGAGLLVDVEDLPVASWTSTGRPVATVLQARHVGHAE